MAEWSYGVTTCPARLDTLLLKTLVSLAAAGFDRPRLFVDGPGKVCYDLPLTQRDEPVGAYGNWVLAAWELYVRKPQARMYAIFQDDALLCRGVREYLDRTGYPCQGYLNLLTFASNESKIFGRPRGWHRSDQLGKGAVALVFDHVAMYTMLRQSHMLDKPQLANGNQSIDGAVQHALVAQAKFVEYVHQPSLAQHVGDRTTIGSDLLGRRHPQSFPRARTFPGEDYDVRNML